MLIYPIEGIRNELCSTWYVACSGGPKRQHGDIAPWHRSVWSFSSRRWKQYTGVYQVEAQKRRNDLQARLDKSPSTVVQVQKMRCTSVDESRNERGMLPTYTVSIFRMLIDNYLQRTHLVFPLRRWCGFSSPKVRKRADKAQEAQSDSRTCKICWDR